MLSLAFISAWCSLVFIQFVRENIYLYNFYVGKEYKVPKLTLGSFLTLSVRNEPNLQSYLFQENISLNPRRVEQNYTIYINVI